MTRWEVTLTESEVEGCKQNAGRIDSQHGSSTCYSYTGINVDHGNFVGNCGELAFTKWCDEFGIVYEWSGSNSDQPGKDDFVLQLDHGPDLSVDVKSSHHDKAAFLMIPFAQFDKHRHDAYIGCTGVESGEQVIVTIHGIVSRRVIKARGNVLQRKCLTVQYPLNYLTRLDPMMFQRSAA